MQVRVKNTIGEVSILIVSDDVECAQQIIKQPDLSVCSIHLAASHDELPPELEHFQPQVIIAIDDSNAFALNLFQEFVTDGDLTRPVLICVSNNPINELFAVADQVIPAAYIPHIGQIIASHLQRVQESVTQERQFAALEAHNLQLGQELVTAIQKSAELALLKQTIVHSVSHELRTPMLQVKSAVALLGEDEHINRTIVDLAMEATTRLEGGIRNVTLLNELMNESPEGQQLGAASIDQIIQAAIRNVGRSWEHKKAVERININTFDKACMVRCDRQRLTIALQLLLDNALKFSQGNVCISVVPNGKKVSISIHDKGIGISPDQFARIFEPFYQIDGSSTRRYGGMGIGLAIVRLIMDHHNTTIRIDSKPDAGSTFTFDLPSGGD